MIRKRQVYKVCYVSKDKLRSAICPYSPQSLVYAEGKRTVPKVGKIIIFDTYRQAKKFASSSIYQIWRGIAENVEKPKCDGLLDIIILMYEEMFDSIKLFWSAGDTRGEFYMPIPEGTLFCDAITLTKRAGRRRANGRR